MTTLGGRPATALLVVDVQNAVVANAHDREAVVGRIAGLVDRAREAGTQVVWVQHHDGHLAEGSDEWQVVPELQVSPDEPVVGKSYGDAFEGTNLEQVLAGRGIGHLVAVGAETDACIRSTIHGALTRGYDVTLVSDAHTVTDRSEYGAPPAADVIAHTNLYWAYTEAPGRTARVVSADELSFDPA